MKIQNTFSRTLKMTLSFVSIVVLPGLSQSLFDLNPIIKVDSVRFINKGELGFNESVAFAKYKSEENLEKSITFSNSYSKGFKTVQLNTIRKEKEEVNIKNNRASGLASFLTTLDNKSSNDAIGNFVDLGTKINDFRIRLHDGTKYECKTDTLVITQKERYLTFNLINRGVLAFDSLKYTVNEYINTIKGSPLTFRFSQKWEIDKTRQNFKKATNPNDNHDPKSLFLFDQDIRIIPIPENGRIKRVMPTLHGIISYANVSSLEMKGNSSSLFVQLSANFAYVPQPISKILYIEENNLSSKMDNLGWSLEGVIGLSSLDKTFDNISGSFVLRPKDVVGSRINFSLNFTPQ